MASRMADYNRTTMGRGMPGSIAEQVSRMKAKGRESMNHQVHPGTSPAQRRLS